MDKWIKGGLFHTKVLRQEVFFYVPIFMFLSTFKGTFCTKTILPTKNHIIRFLSSFLGNINTNSFLLSISMIFMKMIFLWQNCLLCNLERSCSCFKVPFWQHFLT